MRLRIRHLGLLVRDIAGYGRVSGLWWVLPLFVVLTLATVAAATTQAVVPYTVYSLF